MFQVPLPFRVGYDMFHDFHITFRQRYKCFSVSMIPGNEREDVERGGKIIMPPSALEQLSRATINYPMLFKLTNPKFGKQTHCGVLEFVADEGKIYLPHWMMQNLSLNENDTIEVENITLPVATFSKFQPLTSDFLDITNPKAVLENSLRLFACLSKGDVIAIKYNDRVYELLVLETMPGSAVSIIECDMNVDFAPPMDYKQDEKEQHEAIEAPLDLAKIIPPSKGFTAFSGESYRLDGKKKKVEKSVDVPTPVYQRGIPDYNYKLGTVQFFRHAKPEVPDATPAVEFEAFSGKGIKVKDVDG